MEIRKERKCDGGRDYICNGEYIDVAPVGERQQWISEDGKYGGMEYANILAQCSSCKRIALFAIKRD